MGCTSDMMCPALPPAWQALAALSLSYPCICGGRTLPVPTGQCLSSSTLFPGAVSPDPCFWVGKLTWVASCAGFSGRGGTKQYPIHVLELRAVQSTCSPFPYHKQGPYIRTETEQFSHQAGRCHPPHPLFSAGR